MVIRFSPEVADRVREREWHESQELRELPDHSLEVTLRLGSLVEVQRWILGWGRAAEALAPAELCRQLKATVSELAKIYGRG